MKERPILFSGAMVRAILSGQKTVTRRVVKPALPDSVAEILPFAGSPEAWMPSMPGSPEQPWEEQIRVCPYGKPGDRLWVRETWADVNMCGAPAIAYRADEDIRDLMAEGLFLDEDGAFNYQDPRWKKYPFCDWYAELHLARWRPSIHMPRWAARILLEITAVRVERLQDISEGQAEAEGVRACEHDLDPDGNGYSATELFSILWSSLYGIDSYNANPWVWVFEFKRVEVANA